MGIMIWLSDLDGVVIAITCIFLFFLIGYLVWKNDIKQMRKNK